MLRAYQLVGFTPDRDYRYMEINRALRELHPGVVAEAIAQIEKVGGHVDRDLDTDLLTINREFTMSIVIARCLELPTGSLRWNVRFDTGLQPDVTVVLRMDRPNRVPLDYYILPRIDMTVARLRLAEHNGISLDAYRFETLDPLYGMGARVKLREAA